MPHFTMQFPSGNAVTVGTGSRPVLRRSDWERLYEEARRADVNTYHEAIPIRVSQQLRKVKRETEAMGLEVIPNLAAIWTDAYALPQEYVSRLRSAIARFVGSYGEVPEYSSDQLQTMAFRIRMYELSHYVHRMARRLHALSDPKVMDLFHRVLGDPPPGSEDSLDLQTYWNHMRWRRRADRLMHVLEMGLTATTILSDDRLLAWLELPEHQDSLFSETNWCWDYLRTLALVESPHRDRFAPLLQHARSVAGNNWPLPANGRIARWVFGTLHRGLTEKGNRLYLHPVVPYTPCGLSYTLEEGRLVVRAGTLVLHQQEAPICSKIRYPSNDWYHLWVPIPIQNALGTYTLEPVQNFAATAGVPIRLYLKDRVHMWSVLGRISQEVADEEDLNAPLFWCLMIQAITEATARTCPMTYNDGIAVLLHLVQQSIVDPEIGLAMGFEDQVVCQLAALESITGQYDSMVLYSLLKHIPVLERPIDEQDLHHFIEQVTTN